MLWGKKDAVKERRGSISLRGLALSTEQAQLIRHSLSKYTPSGKAFEYSSLKLLVLESLREHPQH